VEPSFIGTSFEVRTVVYVRRAIRGGPSFIGTLRSASGRAEKKRATGRTGGEEIRDRARRAEKRYATGRAGTERGV
jgi:hypothetical protein